MVFWPATRPMNCSEEQVPPMRPMVIQSGRCAFRLVSFEAAIGGLHHVPYPLGSLRVLLCQRRRQSCSRMTVRSSLLDFFQPTTCTPNLTSGIPFTVIFTRFYFSSIYRNFPNNSASQAIHPFLSLLILPCQKNARWWQVRQTRPLRLYKYQGSKRCNPVQS
jgi:hypothetical protein